jgi:hypothetical protein
MAFGLAHHVTGRSCAHHAFGQRWFTSISVMYVDQQRDVQ